VPKLTKTFVDNAKPPQSGNKIYWDDSDGDAKYVPVKGYGLRVSAGGRRAFVAQGRVHNKAVCFTIGFYGVLTPTEAREKARRVLQAMRDGVDPRDTRKADEAASVTLRQVCDEYVATRTLKESSATELKRHITTSFRGWEDRKLASITKDDCRKRYREIRLHGSRGDRKQGAPGQAAQAFSLLRAMYNFAMRRYERADGTPLILVNPVSGLSDDWVPLKPRESYIPVDRVGAVWNYLETTRETAYDRAIRSGLDLAMFLLLTGARLSRSLAISQATGFKSGQGGTEPSIRPSDATRRCTEPETERCGRAVSVSRRRCYTARRLAGR
jgi:hypothetical protein